MKDNIPEVVWEGTYGVDGEGEKITFYPMCPYCGEYAYEDDKCIFCHKRYRLDWSKRPEKFYIKEEE